jgi:hypothetical protein
MSEIVSISLDEFDVKQNLVEPERPYLLLSGIVFEEELKYVVSESGVKSYFRSVDGFKYLGLVDLDIALLDRLKFLGIGVELCRSDGSSVKFEKPEDYYYFVRL